MAWIVHLSPKTLKQIEGMPFPVRTRLFALLKEIELLGPVRGAWKNYGKLSDMRHHCHVKTGRPTYVACWRVISKESKVIEVEYAGTHEKAPY